MVLIASFMLITTDPASEARLCKMVYSSWGMASFRVFRRIQGAAPESGMQ